MAETIVYDGEYILELGGYLPGLEITYTTYGILNEDGSNVVWIGHALTANSDPMEWWPGLVGSGLPIDTDDHFIVCVNMLGSCYGTTGPRSINPSTNAPYGLTFPEVTIRDMVGVLEVIREKLGITHIKLGIGGSMGGQQLLEWAAMKPTLFQKMIVIGTNAKHSPWGKAFNATQLRALENDPSFTENTDSAGRAGLELARGIAMLSYRSFQAFERTQQDPSNTVDGYRAASYLEHQGRKLSDRFHAHAYARLVSAMSSHDLARWRNRELKEVLNQIESMVYAVGITSDYLFPTTEQRFIAKSVRNGQFFEIDSPYGHDGFLIEYEKLSVIIGVAMED